MAAEPAAPRLLLASTSPRRLELLRQAGIPFATVTPGDEPPGHGRPAGLAEQRAVSKARGARRPAGATTPVLGVDTVVALGDAELAKADDAAQALAFLERLSGRIHDVFTAHCLWWPDRDLLDCEVSHARVEFAAADARALAAYVAAGTWRGKAGAYGIQDPLATFVHLREGAFDTVVGLHVPAVRRLLARAGGDGR